MNNTTVCISVIFTLFFVSCSKQKAEKQSKQHLKTYLHLSHTRTTINPKLDGIVEQMDFDKFDMLWLGGDLAQLTSEDDATMIHVDSIFDFGNQNTLWSLGNHDYTSVERVRKYTKRPTYYSIYNHGITIVVLDTQVDSLSNIIGAQKEFLFGILDTIKKSSHLVILHHRLIWMYNNSDLEPKISSIANARFGNCFYCVSPNNFNSVIYPKLVDVAKKGVEVICIGGDIGYKRSEFKYQTKEGVHFLASGIRAGELGNKALLFSHDLENRNLSWEFVRLEGL